MPYLGLLDISGIQNFIFRQPELAFIAESSKRVEEMSQKSWFEARIQKVGVKVQCLIAAGGNAAFSACHSDDLKTLFRFLSHELIEDGHGLQIVVAVEPYEDDELASAYLKALRTLERNKFTQPRSTEFTFSGLDAPKPPNMQQAEMDPLTADQYGLAEPRKFDNLICESGDETNLMAVVSVDGIGMGQRLHDWLQEMQQTKDTEFIAKFTAWSDYIKARWNEAWQKAREEIVRVFPRSEEFKLTHTADDTDKVPPSRKRWIRLKKDGQFVYYPCRKIYQGGDDMVFVCDARVAMSFTALLVAKLEEKGENKRDMSKIAVVFHTLTVSVGITFVESSFPFIRAVKIADGVRLSAKKAAVKAQANIPGRPAPSTIDWWVNRQGALERPDPLIPGVRPCTFSLTDSYSDISWHTMNELILPGMWDRFRGARNKLKDVTAAAEEGEERVVRLLRLRPLREINGRKDFHFAPDGWNPQTGFENGGSRTFLVDAGELFDIHYPFPSPSLDSGTEESRKQGGAI